MSNAQKRISITLLAGAVLIAGALFIRSDTNDTSSAQQDIAVVAKAPERKPIKTLDKNNDGVPDWQEALLVTEAVELSEDISEYKEPETLTEKFALDFFQDIVRAENYGAFGDTPEELVFQASDELSKQVADTLLGPTDITTFSTDSVAQFASYGETIAEITTRYQDTSGENEAVLLERALREQDKTILDPLDSKIAVYENILRDTKALPVPEPFEKEHLDLLNSYQAILNDISAMRNAFNDPMLALLRMKRYQDDAIGLSAAFDNLFDKVRRAGATWEADSPVYLFIK